jgi:hypothetical protein
MLLRISLIIAILAGIGAIVLSQTKLRDHIQEIINQRDTNAKEREQQRTRANTAEKHLNTTSNELVQTKGELTDTKKELDTTKTDLTSAQGARDKALADLEKSRNAEQDCKQNLVKWDAIGKKPEEIIAAIKELEKTTNTIVVLEGEKAILGRKVKALQSQIDSLISPGEYEAPLPIGLKGKILAVDPKWEFVVLDIGQNQGALKDGVMKVHRGSKLIGKVKITNVMPDRAIANIMPGWKLDDIREGDEVLN